MNLSQLDKKNLGREGKPEGVIVGKSADSYFTDARGRNYVYFMMGWCAGNLGCEKSKGTFLMTLGRA